MTAFAERGKPGRTIESPQIERRYRNVVPRFLSGQPPNFTRQRHVHVADILQHLPYGREPIHLGPQEMADRHSVPDKYSAEITDRYRDRLDGSLPDPALFDDLPGGASGEHRSSGAFHGN